MSDSESEQLSYPKIRRNDLQIYECFGQMVPDPYRWMENLHSPDHKRYRNIQNLLTKTFLKRNKCRGSIEHRLNELIDIPLYACPIKRADRYFWCEQFLHVRSSVLYCTTDFSLPPEILLDHTTLSLSHKQQINAFGVSPNGAFVCFEVENLKNHRLEFRFINCATKEELPEVIKNVTLSSITWEPWSRGLFYTTYMNPNEETQGCEKLLSLMFHQLGSDQKDDRLCFQWVETSPNVFTKLSHCGRYLIVTVFDSKKRFNRLCYIDLNLQFFTIDLTIVSLVDTFENRYTYVTNVGKQFIIQTDFDAPMNKLITIDLEKPSCTEWTDLVPHDDEALLEHAVCVSNNRLVLSHVRVAKSYLTVHDLDTGNPMFEIPIPIGRVRSLMGHPDDPEVFFRFESFNAPCTVYRIDLDRPGVEIEIIHRSVPFGESLSDLEVKQVFYQSKDDVSIPMFIVHTKTLQKNGVKPCKLSVFGGFGLINSPFYSAPDIWFLQEFGGTLAVANVRGGGEYGARWHEAARGKFKQTSIDDFLAASQYVVDQNYTNVEKLIIEGRENGAMICAAAALQRPEFYQAVILDNPVTDMLRYYRFSSTARWIDEYGNPYHEDQFEALLRYSPVHTVLKMERCRADDLPHFMILTDPKTSAVEPVHSYKFTACLQHFADTIIPKPIVINWIRGDSLSEYAKCTAKLNFIQQIMEL